MSVLAAAVAGSVINGGNFNDNLNGTIGNDTIDGGAGDDIINADAGAAFGVSAYLERHTDIAAAGVNPLVHLVGWGLAEGRVFTSADPGWIG